VERGLRNQGAFALTAAKGPLSLSNCQLLPALRGLSTARIDHIHRQTRAQSALKADAKTPWSALGPRRHRRSRYSERSCSGTGLLRIDTLRYMACLAASRLFCIRSSARPGPRIFSGTPVSGLEVNNTSYARRRRRLISMPTAPMLSRAIVPGSGVENSLLWSVITHASLPVVSTPQAPRKSAGS